MADTITGSGDTLKELLKDPQMYVIAVIIGTGGYLMKGNDVSATWYVGLGLIAFGVVVFIAKVIHSLFESSFKRKYTELIGAQSSAIKSQRSVITELSKNTIAAHANMTTPTKLSGGYTRDSENITPTS